MQIRASVPADEDLSAFVLIFIISFSISSGSKQTEFLFPNLHKALMPCYFAAWGDDEGTLGSNKILVTLSKLFYVLRFPTHTILWKLFSFNAGLFIVGLILNCMFYGLLIERTISLFKFKKA